MARSIFMPEMTNLEVREYLERVRTKWFIITTLFGPIFFIGIAIIAGLSVPLSLALLETSTETTVASGLLAISALLELSGDLSVRHSILRAGLHSALLPRPGTGI